PVDHLSAIPMFAHHFAGRLRVNECVVASPDVGGIKRVQLLREQLQRHCAMPVESAYIAKRRVGDSVASESWVGDIRGRIVVLLDDLCASGGTLIRAAAAARAAGAREIHVAVTHLPLAEGRQRLSDNALIDSVVATDSVGPEAGAIAGMSGGNRFAILPCAALLGSALARLATGRSLTPLLQSWPAGDE
ncbi:MAG: phosphoribosyltransferase family protein, partial [Steroidobacteraceae bacterium]|nr:phosphoribosyltransferase family protein [Steroidobacteraceae bacterium]